MERDTCRTPTLYPMERDDSANALSVIEEGDEQDLNAEAFADMAMSGMDMNLELNALQIDRNGAFSAAVQPTDTHTKRSAYEELKNGAVHYSRREDKMRALQEHPVVASVSTDGRSVSCKCGRSVRLNPPWYILKFEQHVASRNCTFLRQGRSKKRKRTENKETGDEAEKGDADGQEAQGDQADDVEEITGEYSLQSVDAILRREFGVMQNGQQNIELPPDDSPDHRIRMFKGAITLRENSHFKRITPDGKFVECKCSRIVLLGGPWQPGQFLMHIADKQKPKKRAKTAFPAVASDEWKKKKVSTTARTMVSQGVLMRPPTSASALLQAYKSKKSFPREIRWDVARARSLLPCPGLRDEHNSEYDHADEADNGQLDHLSTTHKRQPKLQQLLEAEKLLLHDVIEGEALWFVDKDGNSVRSLDCLGVVDSSKGEDRCASCTALRSNAALRTAAAAKYKVAIRPGPPRNPINRKFCSGRVCSLLEAEFDMQEPYARVLRDLALADIPSALNTWMEMATMGLSGDFDSHSALLGLTEAMPSASLYDGASNSTAVRVTSDDGFVHLLDPSVVGLTSPEDKAPSTTDDAVMPTNHVPCTGLRDENVQAYVSNAVQLVGGSRPRYVIARELFPQVFGNDKKVRIVDKLNEEQRLILQDAVFSECLWRVDKEGRCVRSLRCKRFVPATDTITYVPSVYTESDPFLRKLSKNSAFRGLYQTVKHMVSPGSGSNSDVDAERLKQVHFWLRFARMGVFGHFKSHPVFEGLMKSMVEMKDKERRVLWPHVAFAEGQAAIVKYKSSGLHCTTQSSIGAESAPVEDTSGAHQPLPSPTHQHQHYLMPPDDLLSRSLSSEESQRFMDRMLDEVRLSVSREMQLVEEKSVAVLGILGILTKMIAVAGS
ncbi:hypothetical protein GQ600_13946 [Phytophthora cactorum]|nr:hypothetical protein GQ600_13946 [Phytophthora cactorum]